MSGTGIDIDDARSSIDAASRLSGDRSSSGACIVEGIAMLRSTGIERPRDSGTTASLGCSIEGIPPPGTRLVYLDVFAVPSAN